MDKADIDRMIANITRERRAIGDEAKVEEGMVRLREVARTYDGEYKLVWSEELAKEMENRPHIPAEPTGIGRLDNLIGGFLPQQVAIVSANSKHGKTSFAMFLMEKLERMNPVMIPLEQSNEELIEQRQERGFPVPRFLSPRRLAARVTLDWIEERIAEGVAKYNTRLIVIDHLGYIDDMGGDRRYARENLAYRIQVMMQGIKNLAKKWGVTIVLLVHISQSDEGKLPNLQDLKGSSAILQEADMVLMLWRKNQRKGKIRIYENKMIISVLANRRLGKNGHVGLRFNDTNGSYEEQTWDDNLKKMVDNHVWVQSWIDRAESEEQADEMFENV